MKLIEFIEYLSERGLTERAELYTITTMYESMTRGLDTGEVLDMEVDEALNLFTLPPPKPGWNTVYGKHVLYG